MLKLEVDVPIYTDKDLVDMAKNMSPEEIVELYLKLMKEREDLRALIIETVTEFSIQPVDIGMVLGGRVYLSYGHHAPILRKLYDAAGLPEEIDDENGEEVE